MAERLKVRPQACGMGLASCCAYLAMDGDGAFCGREDDLLREHIDSRLAAGDMNATRAPTLPYPRCQAEGA